MGIYAYLWPFANWCVSIRAYGGGWRGDPSTDEVPRDTHKQPSTPIDTHDYPYEHSFFSDFETAPTLAVNETG